MDIDKIGEKEVKELSHISVMQGIQLTPREQMNNVGWGESVIDAVWNALQQYMTTHAYLAAEAVKGLDDDQEKSSESPQS